MTEFEYSVIDVGGRERSGRISAPNIEDARARLDAKRHYIVRLEHGNEAGTPLLSPQLFARKILSAKQLMLFTRQLATLAQVSPLEEALRTISRQSEQPHVRQILQNVHAGVMEGRRLSDAMQRGGKSFPTLYRAMVAAGESSGSLPIILERLSDLLERQAQVRSKVTSALAYPIVLALVALCVVMALMIFVVPKVVEQFDTVGQQLPLLTRIVMGLSYFMAAWWWAMGIALILCMIAGWRVLQVPHIRLKFDRWLLRIPLIGRLIRDLHAARMARTLATMVSSRLPLLEGLTITGQTIHNRALRAASDDIIEAIRGGGSLSVALKQAGIFPPLLVYLTASGEAAGKLDMMLERAADYLEREFDSFTTTALSLLEPAIIIAMGGLVAVIILSILLPILQLQSLAGI